MVFLLKIMKECCFVFLHLIQANMFIKYSTKYYVKMIYFKIIIILDILVIREILPLIKPVLYCQIKDFFSQINFKSEFDLY